MRQLLPLVLSALAAGGAAAQTVTAICKEPVGRELGVLGPSMNNEAVDGPDALTGSSVTITWQVGQSVATMVVDSGNRKTRHSTHGILFFRSEEQMSFVTTYPGAALHVLAVPETRKASHRLPPAVPGRGLGQRAEQVIHCGLHLLGRAGRRTTNEVRLVDGWRSARTCLSCSSFHSTCLPS